MDKCAFCHGNKCVILTVQNCSKCKFRKTEEDLMMDDFLTKKRLEDKGLEKVLLHTDEGPKISVRRKET